MVLNLMGKDRIQILFKTAILIASFFIYRVAIAQTKFYSVETEITVKGTSSLHDWEMKSDKGNTETVINWSNDSVPKILSLKFSLPSESLKSHNSKMDKNAYKSLKTKENEFLTFSIISSNITMLESNTFKVKGFGHLEIAGVMDETEIIAICKIEPDKSWTCEGSKQIKMSDYAIEPPNFMLGTIKTGNEITITFKQKLTHKL